MTPLGERIARQIAVSGPIGVADYMAACLFDPEHGYYTTREPFGTAGDFTTAPEISQMFGEIVGVFLVNAWRAQGAPMPVSLAEIGPGRGTLMKDMLRVVRRLAPEFVAGGQVAMVEASPRLADVQRATLAGCGFDVSWHETIDSLPAQPLLIVGNELFDALPVRQFVRTTAGWRERMVALGDDGQLILAAGAASLDPALLPPDAAAAGEGAIVEVAPARTALMVTIAERIARRGGVGLFPDYGYLRPAVGDTLQAVRHHAYDDVLAHPGEADLTSHVDFAALAAATRQAGLDAVALTQGRFLIDMGLLERAGQLGANADEAARERLRVAVERLAGPEAMGDLFKVLCVAPEGAMPAPFASGD